MQMMEVCLKIRVCLNCFAFRSTSCTSTRCSSSWTSSMLCSVTTNTSLRPRTTASVCPSSPLTSSRWPTTVCREACYIRTESPSLSCWPGYTSNSQQCKCLCFYYHRHSRRRRHHHHHHHHHHYYYKYFLSLLIMRLLWIMIRSWRRLRRKSRRR